MTNTTAEALKTALQEMGYRAQAFPADGVTMLADCVNLWADPADRYPAATVYSPFETPDPGDADPNWTWGPNFEHSAPGDIAAAVLATLVLLTLETT